ncbi:hypothetical protein GTS_28050 [Gandjariella thermophila]|uniref:DUF4328 domain-containing protein n=2 Tax=Gandjariella thermophila TaxID=1931992 RepID=A0A4D4J7K0_9PSEU|nr:hypothetical protein GTS_28050 [Gandjariella thermophila]
MRVDWVATPPPGAQPPRFAPRRLPYTGPPSYPATPRWGFPLLVWRWPTALPPVPGSSASVSPVDRARATGAAAVQALWITAALCLTAACGEGWRYTLLLASRYGALSGAVVSLSDALVITTGVVSVLAALLSLLLAVLWLRRAREVAALAAGFAPPRPDWQVVLGLLLPGINLVVPGSALAELEHAALGRPAATRPTPSRLVLLWWGAWVVGVLLFVLTVLWSFRGGVQAAADGVLLHAVNDLAAAALAVLTIRVVHWINGLIGPVDTHRVRRARVVRVTGAPPPPLRPARPAGVRR